jgi:hypothetical protein
MKTQLGGATRDLCWWEIPRWVIRRRFRILFGVVTGVPIAFALQYVLGEFLGEFGFGTGFALAAAVLVGIRLVRPPRSMILRRPTWPELRASPLRALRGGLYGGLAGTLGSAFLYATIKWWPWRQSGLFEIILVDLTSLLLLGFIVGLPAGLVIWFGIWLVDVWSVPIAASPDVTPYSVYRRDRLSLLVSAIMLGIAAGSSLLLLIWLLTEDQTPLLGFVVGFSCGFLVGAAGSARFSLLIVEAALSASRGRRVRFLPCWRRRSHVRFFVRLARVYQFRHAELQDRLADQHRHRVPTSKP